MYMAKSKLKKLDITYTGVLLFCAGLIVPWIALAISVRGLLMGMPNGGCVTGAGVFLFFGYVINLVGIPFLWLLFCLLKINNIKELKKEQNNTIIY